MPEPYNNLAVLYAQKGDYNGARIALETAVTASPDFAVAHENLGDIYARLAAANYDRAAALDKGNKSAPAKLVLVRQLLRNELAGMRVRAAASCRLSESIHEGAHACHAVRF